MTNELEGRVAVVSGGSKGIGFAVAERLARNGADVLLAASNEARLIAAAKRIVEATARRVERCVADLRTPAGCEKVQGKVADAFGGCDILINSAGATKGGKFLEQPDEEWHDGFALKLYSAVRLARLLWPMLSARKGVVINIVGGFARTPAADFMVGGAVNAALANFSKSLAEQGLRDDVNVNWIHPGMTVTERLQEIFDRRAEQQDTTPDDIRERSVAAEGIRRLGEPEDVANLVAFLCSPGARHIHGTGISVDGGATKGVF